LVTVRSIADKLYEQASGSRSAVSANTTLWVEPKMGNQRLARQIKRRDVAGLAPVINERCQGPGHIDESDIAHSESNGLVVMVHC
jgi:hypothetical protein